MIIIRRPPIFVPGGDATHKPFWIIPVTQGLEAYVSDWRFRRHHIGEYNWCASKRRGKLVYAARGFRIDGAHCTILLHHQLGFKFHDHKNGNGLDCRDENMRKLPTFGHNLANRFVSRTDKASKYKGVRPNPASNIKPWTAGITIDGKRKYLGSFRTEVAAALAWDRAALKLWGDAVAINFKRLMYPNNRYLFETCPRITRR